MRSVGKFIYKGLEKREGGSFTNEKGQAITYKESYVLKVDEQTEQGIFERKLKISTDNVELIEKIKKLSPYAPVSVTCDISFYGNNPRVVPLDIALENNNK